MLEWSLRTNVSLVSVFCTHALGAASSNYITCAIEFLAIRKLEHGGSFLIVLVIQFVVCSLVHFDIARHEWRQSDESSDERGSSSSPSRATGARPLSSSSLFAALTTPHPGLRSHSGASQLTHPGRFSVRSGPVTGSALPHILSPSPYVVWSISPHILCIQVISPHSFSPPFKHSDVQRVI